MATASAAAVVVCGSVQVAACYEARTFVCVILCLIVSPSVSIQLLSAMMMITTMKLLLVYDHGAKMSIGVPANFTFAVGNNNNDTIRAHAATVALRR